MLLNCQCLLGMQCRDFTIIAADQTNTQSIIVMKNDEDKLFPVSDKLLMGINGDSGDIAQLSQFVAKNLQLYERKNGYQLDTPAAVHFTRKTLAESFKYATPCLVNILIGGHDENGGHLYYMDFLGACVKVPYAAHGFGGLFCASILESRHNLDLTESEAYDVMLLCVSEIKHRLILNLGSFQVKVVSKDGITVLPTIAPVNCFC